ncbi:GNAT family N-acetyltransferase [Endozoicomonas sp.]|uniref:GNAT family N-acetyltransferase n=1 Tax=Endozoicomonas sp. TaxID=1892382 RepID=UPI0028883F82|nr:GNAT family N-acetyltransferase [Endozoicomonas sp.]
MTESATFSVAELDHLAFPLVNRFFKENGHKGKARGGERAWIARNEQGVIVAGLRASPKSAGYLLRSVWVSGNARRQGIGSRLLNQTMKDMKSLASATCWCYPYSHLETFYRRAGFIFPEIESIPSDILQPYQRYQQQGQDFLLMARFPQ